MKIRDIAIVPLTAPYIRPNSQPSHPSNGLRNCVWVRIDTDDGVSGWGEAYCGCYATEVTVAALRRLQRSLIGADAADIDGTLAEMRFRNRYWAMRGVGAQSTSAIESALWDIAGQRQGRPVWQLLGDGTPRPIVLYASAGDSGYSPDAIRREAGEFASRGFRAYKIRCGGRLTDNSDRLAIDAERVAAAREALGPDRLLFADVAVPQKFARWDFAKSSAYLEMLYRYQVRFLEEPAMTYDVAMYRRLQDLKFVPTAGGESFCSPEEFEPFFEAGALGVAQPDAAVVGGPASCAAVIRRAHSFGVPVAVHAWSAGVGLAQNLHAAWSSPGVLSMEWPMSTHALASEPIREIANIVDGVIQPSIRPGLGVTIDDDFLRRYALQPGSERDY